MGIADFKDGSVVSHLWENLGTKGLSDKLFKGGVSEVYWIRES
jgi:hypothetical protein